MPLLTIVVRIEWSDIRFSNQKCQGFGFIRFSNQKCQGFGFATCGKVTQDPGCSDWNGHGNQSSVVGSNLAPPAGMRLMV